MTLPRRRRAPASRKPPERASTSFFRPLKYKRDAKGRVRIQALVAGDWKTIETPGQLSLWLGAPQGAGDDQ